MSDVCCIGADKLRRMTAFVGSAKIYRKGSDYLNDNNYDITKYLPPYVTKDDCLYERKSGTEIIRLADFVPLLKSEVTYDDGIEQKKQFRIGGVHCTGEELPEVTVSADDMSNMRWLLAKWGVLGATQPGKNTLSKIGHAILCTRESVTKETVYLQTGWHKIGREYFFLLPCKDSEYTTVPHFRQVRTRNKSIIRNNDILGSVCIIFIFGKQLDIVKIFAAVSDVVLAAVNKAGTAFANLVVVCGLRLDNIAANLAFYNVSLNFPVFHNVSFRQPRIFILQMPLNDAILRHILILPRR